MLANLLVNPAVVRNVIRYVAGGAVTIGLVSPDTASVLSNDPVLNQFVLVTLGSVAGLVTEAVYSLAKKFGWRT